jgi:hypothetical protein
MKNRTIVSALILITLSAAPIGAWQVPDQRTGQLPGSASPLQGRVFVLKHASPRHLMPVLQPLTSGKDAVIAASNETMTISVRDFPENLAAIEAAIKLLDKPVSDRPAVGLDLRISLIAASQEPLESGPEMPRDLASVVEQLRRTLTFKNYRYVTTLSQRTVDFGPVGASGPTANFFPSKRINKPAFYEYALQNIRVVTTSEVSAVIQVENFHFKAKIPVVANPQAVEVGTAAPDIEYQTLSLATGLTLRDGEQVVVGTTGVGEGDKALIVVVSISRAKA